jgi:protein-disulfide isomerase
MKSLFLFSLLLFPAVAGTESPGKTEGAAVAPLIVEVYSDFQCPSCKNFHDMTLPSLLRDYVATGKAFLIYREFPLPMHAYSREAAKYATAAGRIGKYADVCNALFAKQVEWSANGKVADVACSPLNPVQAKKVREMVKDPSIVTEIDRDVNMGRSAKVDSTPTLVVTHKLKRYPVSANTNYNLLRQLLDGLLAR